MIDPAVPAETIVLNRRGGGSARLRPLVGGDGLAMVTDFAEVQPGTRLIFLTFSEALCA